MSKTLRNIKKIENVEKVKEKGLIVIYDTVANVETVFRSPMTS